MKALIDDLLADFTSVNEQSKSFIIVYDYKQVNGT